MKNQKSLKTAVFGAQSAPENWTKSFVGEKSKIKTLAQRYGNINQKIKILQKLESNWFEA